MNKQHGWWDLFVRPSRCEQWSRRMNKLMILVHPFLLTWRRLCPKLKTGKSSSSRSPSGDGGCSHLDLRSSNAFTRILILALNSIRVSPIFSFLFLRFYRAGAVRKHHVTCVRVRSTEEHSKFGVGPYCWSGFALSANSDSLKWRSATINTIVSSGMYASLSRSLYYCCELKRDDAFAMVWRVDGTSTSTWTAPNRILWHLSHSWRNWMQRRALGTV